MAKTQCKAVRGGDATKRGSSATIRRAKSKPALFPFTPRSTKQPAGMRRRLWSTSALAPLGIGVLVAGAFILTASPAHAVDLPTGGNVVGGSGSISQNGQIMDITQTSARMAIDWQSFSIGAGSTVNFHQPSSSSVALNRVLGSDVSVIRGALNANGHVFLVNPNGVLFSQTSEVNVGGLVASTLDIATEDFMAGNYRFEGGSTNAVVNQGNINAQGGTVGLIAARIVNEGNITAEGGSVVMGAGSRVRLDLGGPVQIEVEQGALDALIEQGGGVMADGGLVYLTAKAAGNLAATVINHTGITQARTLATGESGEIYLMGGMERDRIQVGGTLDASAPDGGDGGFIETSAAVVSFSDDLSVTTRAADGQTGTWLIDPTDVRIISNNESDMLQADQFSVDDGSYRNDVTTIHTQLLGSALEDSNVIIETPGDGLQQGNITFDSNFAWEWNTLTLRAHNDILINAVLSATVSAGLVMDTNIGGGTAGLVRVGLRPSFEGFGRGFAGRVDMADDATLRINGNVYTLISDAAGLQNMTIGGHYALANDITLVELFNPIRDGEFGAFTGTFNGLGHTISDLEIKVGGIQNHGLFAMVDHQNAYVGNVGLLNVDVEDTGDNYNTGSLIGYLIDGIVYNSFSTGSVKGIEAVGGLIGKAGNADGKRGRVSYAYSTAAVNGSEYVGGLIGHLEQNGDVFHSYSTGDVTGGSTIGGLIGRAMVGTSVSYSFSTGDVVANGQEVGGLVGRSEGELDYTYSTGKVEGDELVGGLVGELGHPGRIDNSFSSGAVSGNADVGGLVGVSNAAIDSTTLWDVTSSGQAESPGGSAGRTTAQMHLAATYEAQEWMIAEDPELDNGYPMLAWALGDYGINRWVIGTKGGAPTTTTTTTTTTERPNADAFAVQQAAAVIAPTAPSFTLPQATPSTPAPNVASFGGLRYVSTPAPAQASGGESAGAAPGVAPASTGGGRDAAGFMNVFVVGGGVNTAAAAPAPAPAATPDSAPAATSGEGEDEQ